MDRVVRIGGAGGFFSDSALNVPQLIQAGVDYLVFDSLSESVMGRLGPQAASDPNGGWLGRFLDAQIGPFLGEIAQRRVKVISNAGGANPSAAAAAIRKRIAAEGLALKVAAVEGDDLTARGQDFAGLNLREMHTGRPMAEALAEADAVRSFTAYTGGFPIAQALAAGADIVVAGRCVDTAPALGALIHEFGWGPDDFDRLAAGTALGHLLECGSASVGGTFTDWREVGGWDDMGYPIVEAHADGSGVLTKPPGTGGLVSVAAVSEAILYEVRDVAAYIVPDVVCDWSHLSLTQDGPDRVRISGARGLPRTATYKACLTYADGWRATVATPIVGVEAVQKAERLAEAMLARAARLLRLRNLGEWRRTCVEIVGAESAYGPRAASAAAAIREVVCRVAVEHDAREAVEMFNDEALPFIAHVTGVTMPMQANVVPVQKLASFLIDKSEVELFVSTEEGRERARVPADGQAPPSRLHPPPPLPEGTDLSASVPLLALALVRSGDKGDLANLGVVARRPEFVPYIAHSLTPDAVGGWYAHLFNDPAAAPRVERQFAPGLSAFNFILHEIMGGGLSANLRYDAPGKGLGQLLLDIPIPVPRELERRLTAGDLTWT
jgi:hypothetical protein